MSGCETAVMDRATAATEEKRETVQGTARRAARREAARTTIEKVRRDGDMVEQAQTRPRWPAE